MDENQSTSWDDLIKQLGAAPPADATERKRPAIETQFEPPATTTPPARPVAGDWSSLAHELGVEAAEPERPAPPAAGETTHSEGGPSNQSLEASFASIEPMASEFQEIVDEEIVDVDFGVSGEDDGTSDAAIEDESTLSGEAARNAFEALFQAGSFAAMPPVEPPVRRPEQRRAGPQWRDPESLIRRRSDDDEEEPSAEADELRGEVQDEQQGAADAEKGGRRRRRRRRGRGRDRDAAGEQHQEGAVPGEADVESDEWGRAHDEEGPQDAESGDLAADADEAAEKPARRRPRRRRRGGSAEDADGAAPAGARIGRSASPEVDDDDDDDDDDDHELAVSGDSDMDDDSDADEGGRRSAHKNIPTWSEAIGVMVETNMQSRKSSPQRPSGSRERGRGRGRGRGGRRGKP
jgi:hypothetical protein